MGLGLGLELGLGLGLGLGLALTLTLTITLTLTRCVLGLSSVQLNASWVASFGAAKVCSEVLLELHMDGCGLQGPIPELELAALRILYASDNELMGGLEPLRGCISL